MKADTIPCLTLLEKTGILPRGMTKKRVKKRITSDIHALYEASVQCVDHDSEILEQLFQETVGRKPNLLREDFCGTYALCCEWVRRNPDHRAIGLDLCKSTLAYGTRTYLPRLNAKQRKRVQVYLRNVQSTTKPADLIAACNFSYFIFKSRKELLTYFRHCHKSLKPDGTLILDIFGGTETEIVMKERRRITSDDILPFTYVWDLDSFNPVTREAQFYIHFRFPKDGPKVERAFSYHWRVWTIPELKDIMLEAGFQDVIAFWEDDDEDDSDEGNGEFYATDKECNDPTWLSYIVASKKKSKARIRKKKKGKK